MNLTNLMRVCSYCSYCLDLHVALGYCQVKGCPLFLHHIYQKDYVAINEIDFDRGERKIFSDCVDKTQGQGKSEILNNMIDNIMYRSEESE